MPQEGSMFHYTPKRRIAPSQHLELGVSLIGVAEELRVKTRLHSEPVIHGKG